MARRLHQTLADYVVIAISPALIMTLVGSLVFFLLTVVYRGDFALRLHWVMACFVFAAVLIARISIEEGLERALPFGAALAIVVGLASTKFMEVQGGWLDQFGWLVNWGLIGLIWWCAHRLTWDCTLVDDSQDASGEGLLQTAGLEHPGGVAEPAKVPDELLEGTTSRTIAKTSWWRRFVEQQRRPHAPGVWVIYFSLAALPLFGLGQWFIPESNVAGRRYAFWLLGVYVASGMGLLLTTSFLGLRRYLRQRRIEMPTLMANLWLGTGAAIIALLLVVAALLPRPSAEYDIAKLPFTVGSPGQKASAAQGVPREGTKDQQPGSAPNDKPAPDETKPSPDEPDSTDQGKAIQNAASESPQSEDSTPANASGKSSNASQSSKQPPDKSAGKQAGSRPSSQGDSKSQQRDSQNQSKTPPPKNANQQRDSTEHKSDAPNQQQEQQPTQQAEAEQAKPPGEPPPQQEQPPAASESPPPPQIPPGMEQAAGGLAEIFKWIFYAVFILAVAYGLWRSRAEILAAWQEFLAMLRNFLSGGRNKRTGKTAAALTGEPEFPPAAFASFADPFATGTAARYSLAELVRYSFEAFEAWAREHGCPRTPEQTPHELARDVGKLNAPLAADAQKIAELYARVAYARGELPPTTADHLRHLWQSMNAGAASPF